MHLTKTSDAAITTTLILLASVIAQPARSDDGGRKNAAPPKVEARNTATSGGGDAVADEHASATEIQLQQLREELKAQQATLREQQQRITALEAELRSTRTNGASGTQESTNPEAATPEKLAIRQQETNQKIEATKSEMKVDKKLMDRIEKIGPFSLSGDFRLRDEPFFDGPSNQSQVRNRERFRLRFNGNVKLNDNLDAGFALASGDLNDPISTNQTTNQFYTRKPFSIDRAFITFQPHYFKSLTLIGGKFAYPWYNTELTWDKDLNPEGVAQTLAFDLESVPVLKRIALVGFELPFAETAGVSLSNKSIVQSAVYGGQLQAAWQFSSWLKISTYGAFYNWHNADPVALALATANAASPVNGLLPLKNINVQNSMTVTTATSIVTASGVAQPTGVTKIVAAQFASRFGLLDAIARFDIKTRLDRWPVTLIGDYVQNTRACANLDSIQPAPASSTSTTFSQSTNAPCNPRQRRGYWGEARFGRAEQKGDWQFSYTRIVIEREAVLSAFNYSEIRQGSNVTQHRAELIYLPHRNVQLNFTGLFGRPLNFRSSAPPEDLLERLQFDVIYRF